MVIACLGAMVATAATTAGARALGNRTASHAASEGKGAHHVFRSAELPGQLQAPPTVTPVVNMAEARWTPSLSIRLDPAWPQGVYIAKLLGSAGQQQYAIFTLRDDASHAAYVVKNSVT